MHMRREQAAALEDFARLFEAVITTWPGTGNTQKQPSSPGISAQASLCAQYTAFTVILLCKIS